MTIEIGSHELTVPWPCVFGIRGRVDADESPSAPDESLERRLSVAIEDITRRIEEDDASVPCQVLISEHRCFFVGVDMKIVLVTQRFDGRHSGANRVMAKSCGFGENKDGQRSLLARRLG